MLPPFLPALCDLAKRSFQERRVLLEFLKWVLDCLINGSVPTMIVHTQGPQEAAQLAPQEVCGCQDLSIQASWIRLRKHGLS